MVDKFNWRCPFCQHNTVVTDDSCFVTNGTVQRPNKFGTLWYQITLIGCPNKDCQEITLHMRLHQANLQGGLSLGKEVAIWRLIPESTAKILPEYVPIAIRTDYVEACRIRDLSPKASATLSRRCLQGMIRDFWKISKARLFDEIAALEEKVDPLTWQAIDAVRSVGNIGAHMEKDINVIVDVDPEEAGELIALIELLVDDWYVNRHNRAERLKGVIALGDSKKQAKSSKEPG